MPDDTAPARDEEDREFAAITQADIFEEARDRLNISKEAESKNREEAKADLLFREGEQWDHITATSASQEEPELTINLTDAFVTRVVNNIKQQRPRGKAHPVGDGANVETAEIINGIGRHIETRSEASVAYDGAAEAAVTSGDGYFRLIAEYISPKSFLKDLRILPIRNTFTVNMDPSSIMPSGCDQNWCLISVKMNRIEYKRRYPRADNASWTDIGRDETAIDWEDKENVRLAEYFRIREIGDTLYLLRAQDGTESTRYQAELPKNPETGTFDIDHLVARAANMGLAIEGKRDSVRRSVEWFRLNGRKVVERQRIPGQWIPVFRVEGKATDIDGRVYRRGMVRFLKDPARMVNYGEVAKIKRLGLAPQSPWVAAEGQLDGHPEWNDPHITPYTALTYKPILIETGQGAQLLPPPQRQPPAQIEAGFSEFVQGMRSNLQAVAGMPNEPGQDMQGQVVSGRAIKRRQWLSDQSHFAYYDNLTLAIAQCWRVMVEWIPAYYTEERMQRIIGEDSTPSMVKINERTMDSGVAKVKNDLSVGRYDIVMDTGPGYETKREEGAENLIGLLQSQPLAEIIAKSGADLVFRSIDHPYMQELADRLMASNPEGLKKLLEGLSGRAKSIVQALANQNQALQTQLQAMQQDMKAGITKAHMAAVTKAHDTEVSAATKRHDTETRAQTALDVEEIRGIIELLSKHMDARAAEREMANIERQGDKELAFKAASEDKQLDAAAAQAEQGGG